jgi:hypothetical protein
LIRRLGSAHEVARVRVGVAVACEDEVRDGGVLCERHRRELARLVELRGTSETPSPVNPQAVVSRRRFDSHRRFVEAVEPPSRMPPTDFEL